MSTREIRGKSPEAKEAARESMLRNRASELINLPPEDRDTARREIREMAEGGNPGRARDDVYPGWSDEDFQELINRLEKVGW